MNSEIMFVVFGIYMLVVGFTIAMLCKYSNKKVDEIMDLICENEQLKKELENERKLNFEIKARFVRCNTCTSEMKDKCLMWSENLCEGERCNELIDIQALMNKDNLVIH